jgi:hypothetical protein
MNKESQQIQRANAMNDTTPLKQQRGNAIVELVCNRVCNCYIGMESTEEFVTSL